MDADLVHARLHHVVKEHGPEVRVADPDPNWIRIQSGSVDPDPCSESGSGSRRAKITRKSRKKEEISCFEVLDVLFES
jgi:hypothetical protein